MKLEVSVVFRFLAFARSKFRDDDDGWLSIPIVLIVVLLQLAFSCLSREHEITHGKKNDVLTALNPIRVKKE